MCITVRRLPLLTLVLLLCGYIPPSASAALEGTLTDFVEWASTHSLYKTYSPPMIREAMRLCVHTQQASMTRDDHSTSVQVTEKKSVLSTREITCILSVFKNDPYARFDKDTKQWISNGNLQMRILNDTVLHIRIASIRIGDAEIIKNTVKDLRQLQGIIIDVRGNPGGILGEAYEIADVFVWHGKLGGMKGADGTRTTFMAANDHLVTERIPIIALTDQDTGSAAEALLWALYENGRLYRSIGAATVGKGVYQSIYHVKGMGDFYITTGEVRTPEERGYHKKPFIPDTLLRTSLLETELPIIMAIDLF